MNKQEAIKKYGKKMLKKMDKTGYLYGITICIDDKGEPDVPEEDYERAYIAAKGGRVVDFD